MASWLTVTPMRPPTGRNPSAGAHIESQQIQQIAASLKSYVQGTGSGHSYLISGHRGAGKTTLVQVTVEQVRQATAGGSRQPLIINLSGPSLFASPPLDASGDPTVQPHILNCWRLTEALTLAVQREFLDRLRARAGDDREKLQTLSLLQTRLGGGLEVADLFNVWQAVLGEDAPLLRGPSPYPEILSLWNNIKLHQITAGTPTATFTLDRDIIDKHEQGAALSSTLDKLAPLLVALLSGGVAGIGLDTADVGGSLSVIGAGLVALLAGLTADVTIRWDRTDTRKQAFEYNPDFSVNALPRMLPDLVDQLWNIGLAPVFVVDELDKIDALEGGDGAEALADKMKVLLNHIKSFVTEQSAFFFLVDRDYFEFVERSSRSRAYPIEHTYFNTRLYVSYQPTELRRFLDMVTDHAGELRHQLAQRMISDSMLYRSRLHFFSLRQQLQLLKLRAESGLLPPPDALMRSAEWYYPFLFQAAVERSLESRAMQRRQKDNSYFTQLAVDVLYYPAHRWEAGESFRLDKEEIRDWLQQRLGVAEGVDSGALLSPTDRDFLFSELEKVIDFLCAPQDLLDALQRAPAPEVASGERTVFRDAWQRAQVCDRLPTIRPPLLQDHKDDRRYRWRCTPFGRPLEPRQAPTLSTVYGALRGLLPSDADEIFVALISGFLLGDGGQPAYTDASQLARFRAHAAGSPAEGEEQLADLYALRRAIERQSGLLVSVLMWMTALCAQQGQPTQAVRLRTLSILQQVLIETHRTPKVSLLSPSALGELLGSLYLDLALSPPLTAALSSEQDADWAAAADWLEELSSEALVLPTRPHALSEARESWEQRIRQWLDGRQPDPPTWRDLLSKIYLQPGARHVLTPPGSVTAEQWGEVLEDLEPLAEDDPTVRPLQLIIRQLLAKAAT